MSQQVSPVGLSIAEQLWEIEQIKQLKARYFRFVDTRDWDGVVGLFAPDCEMRSTVFNGIERPTEFFTKVAARITPGISVHHGHMPEITLTSASTAAGVWAMFDYVDTDSHEVGYIGYGHYHETYEKFPGAGWLITTFELRRLRLDHLSERGSVWRDGPLPAPAGGEEAGR